MNDHFKIRSVSDGSAWAGTTDGMLTKQMNDHFEIRSVSDGSAWGVGPQAN